jgi:inositol phosphorylceramide mannosyltransferase catalytic subunit
MQEKKPNNSQGRVSAAQPAAARSMSSPCEFNLDRLNLKANGADHWARDNEFDLATLPEREPPAQPQENKMAIPKIIHQTLPNKGDINQDLVRNIEYIKSSNSDWDYRLYDNTDIELFILQNYDQSVLDIYQKINPSYGPARADFFRYLAVHAVGGVYLDIKSTLTKKLNDMILPDDSFILSQWDNKPGEAFEGWGLHPDPGMPAGGEYQNWHVISAPGHPFLGAVISAVKNNIISYSPKLFGLGKMGVLRTTGPIAYSQAIEKITNKAPHRKVKFTKFGLQYSIYGVDAKSWMHHHNLFGRHYINSNQPIVIQNAPNADGAQNDIYGQISRNAMCPCGSGERFKHCHGAMSAR